MMALVKQALGQVVDLANAEAQQDIDLDSILSALESSNEQERREAIQMISLLSESDVSTILSTLMNLAEYEDPSSVTELAFFVLEQHLTDDVLKWLINCLSSESPFVRNQAIELLQRAPQALAPFIPDLLRHRDPDVRIFTVDILGLLPHTDVPKWLEQVLMSEEHVNVIGTAIDRVTQLADPSLAPAVEQVKQRFSTTPYIVFCCDIALKRFGE